MANVPRSRRGGERRRGLLAIGGIVAVLALLTAGVLGRAACSGPQFGTLANPFAASSPWRQLLPPDPEIDPKSAEMIAGVQQEPKLYANLIEYGIPIYGIDGDTPTHTVQCTRKEYGACPFGGWPVPIPDGAQINTGSDGVLITVDEATDLIYEFWQAKKGDPWTASFGALNSLRGTGWGGASTGAGASRLAGVIRVAEIADRNIPHALALQSENACPTFRPPALKSDGWSDRSDCIPEGARLQLDPTIDLDALGLSEGEKAVATALQRYGGFLMDVAKAPLSVSFELDTHAEPGTLGQTYTDAGFRWDYDAMERIPWEKLRVLK